MVDGFGFQIFLGVVRSVFETKEFQDERVLYEISSFLDNMAFAGQTADLILVPAEGKALVEGTGDLALEFAHAPLVCGGFDLVEFALFSRIDREEFDIVRQLRVKWFSSPVGRVDKAVLRSLRDKSDSVGLFSGVTGRSFSNWSDSVGPIEKIR